MELVREVTAPEEETDLSTRVEELEGENKSLKAELERLRGRMANVTNESESLEERLDQRLAAAVEEVKADIASSTERLAAEITLTEVERESLATLQAELEAMWPDEMLDALARISHQGES